MPASLTLQNRHTRFTLTPGIIGWVYEYVNRETIHKRSALATGLELGVQLRGEWRQRGSRTAERLYGPGMIHRISPAETYDLSFSSTGSSGRQVGFILYPAELPEYASQPGELRFCAGAATQDAQLYALCRELYHGLGPDSLPSELAAQGAQEVRCFIARNCELVPRDPLLVAKLELERNLAQPLYLRHLAEVASMSPTAFSRRFAQRIGMTPIRYRLLLRLNEAARLTWAAPELQIAEIAHRVGFDDPVYFHRAFKRHFGVTPAQYGRRSQAAPVGEQAEPAPPPLQAGTPGSCDLRLA
jgi:AraC-like DNA-binding protein